LLKPGDFNQEEVDNSSLGFYLGFYLGLKNPALRAGKILKPLGFNILLNHA